MCANPIEHAGGREVPQGQVLRGKGSEPRGTRDATRSGRNAAGDTAPLFSMLGR